MNTLHPKTIAFIYLLGSVFGIVSVMANYPKQWNFIHKLQLMLFSAVAIFTMLYMCFYTPPDIGEKLEFSFYRSSSQSPHETFTGEDIDDNQPGSPNVSSPNNTPILKKRRTHKVSEWIDPPNEEYDELSKLLG
jgi:hypothetical protein